MIHKIFGHNHRFGYPFFIFIVVLMAKIGYVYIESGYNFYILEVVSAPKIDMDALNNLNTFGHKISSFGLTLLILPLFVFIFKHFKLPLFYTLVCATTLISYFVIYHSLNMLIDNIVETNKDKRHNAYYTNIFKYGVLNNHFIYNSFIDNTKIKDSALSVDDKILITNTFLITFADEQLISKLKEKGREKISELYLDISKDKTYDKSYEDFKSISDELATFWNQFNENKKILNDTIEQNNNDQKILDDYNKLQSTIEQKFIEYKSASDGISEKIYEETRFDKVNDIYEKLQQYFKYQNYDKAKKQYHDIMLEKFNYEIDPKRWCKNGNCPDRMQIIAVITDEIQKKADQKLNGLPLGLQAIDFLQNILVKAELAKELQKNDILIPENFDYSYSQFKFYYEAALSRKKESAIKDFYKKLEEKIWENDITLNHSWEDFINSSFVLNKIKSKNQKIDELALENIKKLLIAKNIGDFKDKVYLPSVQSEIEKLICSEKQFFEDSLAINRGDEAIKLLYIPPFALTLSMLALLLNLITVVSMILLLTPLKINFTQYVIKPAFLLVLILLPFLITNKDIQTTIIQDAIHKTPEIQKYWTVLNWLKTYEKINYWINSQK